MTFTLTRNTKCVDDTCTCKELPVYFRDTVMYPKVYLIIFQILGIVNFVPDMVLYESY